MHHVICNGHIHAQFLCVLSNFLHILLESKSTPFENDETKVNLLTPPLTPTTTLLRILIFV